MIDNYITDKKLLFWSILTLRTSLNAKVTATEARVLRLFKKARMGSTLDLSLSIGRQDFISE